MWSQHTGMRDCVEATGKTVFRAGYHRKVHPISDLEGTTTRKFMKEQPSTLGLSASVFNPQPLHLVEQDDRPTREPVNGVFLSEV